MDGHPSAGELKAFLYGELKGEQARNVVRHLLSGCKACLVGAPQLAGYAPAPAPRTSEYELAIQRATERAWAAFQAQQQSGRTGEVLAAAAADPQEEVRLASLAIVQADRRAAPAGGEDALADARGRAWMELGHAHRVAGHVEEALYCLNHAKDLLFQGTGEPALAVRLLEIQAALAADAGNYTMAQAALTFVYKFHRRHGNDHLAGRALIHRGLFAGSAGEREQAVGLIDAGLSLIDQEKEPALANQAVQTMLLFLVEAKGARKGRRLES